MTRRLPLLALTMGDPAGVGPELCLHVLGNGDLAAVCRPLVFGDAAVLAAVARRCNIAPVEALQHPVSFETWRQHRHEIVGGAVIDMGQVSPQEFQPGRVSRSTGAANYAYIEAAAKAALDGEVDALVTAPINKEALHAAGIPHPGHTEILAELTAAPRVCMMLTSQEITCSLVTAHVGLHEVPSLLTVPKILDAIELTVLAMRKMRGREPRLTICGLNPHAGEHGLFGRREEEEIIAPAVEVARSQGIVIDGPLPPDTAFLPERRRETDAYICMYHDQGLIPLKMLSFDTAINITLGLPILRTSVDHGTAYDIAWQGKASPSSMFEAVRLAARLC
jgi:4-phospho-D-threonate 3-dehydrogenase / 4-phospho-D-erythronate 3-dehydrogenase